MAFVDRDERLKQEEVLKNLIKDTVDKICVNANPKYENISVLCYPTLFQCDEGHAPCQRSSFFSALLPATLLHKSNIRER